MGFAQERRHHCHHQQQQQPGDVDGQRRGQGGKRDRVLDRREQQGEEADPAHRLAPSPLELVVDLGVLELLQVEGGRVTHELDARLVGEEIAEQALEQGRDAGQPLAHHGDDELQREQLAQPGPVDGAGAAPRRHADRAHDLVDDELPDPEHRQRHQGPAHPQGQNARDVAALGAPHEPQQPRHVAQRLQAGAPAGPGLFGLPAPAVGPYNRMLKRQCHAV